MGSMSISHWIVVLIIIVLLFGAKKLPELAKGTGKAIKTFKKELENDDDLEDKNTLKEEKIKKAESVETAKIKEEERV